MRPRINKGWTSLFKVNGGCSMKQNSNPLPDKEKGSSSMVVPSSSSSSSSSSGRFEEGMPDIIRERWIPTPEQLKILEAVFNSGCSIPPPREDIVRIRMQIEEYAKVNYSSIYYWFQNRKRRALRRPRQYDEDPVPLPQIENPLPPLPNTFVAPLTSPLPAPDDSCWNSRNPEQPPTLYFFPPSTPLPFGDPAASENFTGWVGFEGEDDDVFASYYADLETNGNPSLLSGDGEFEPGSQFMLDFNNSLCNADYVNNDDGPFNLNLNQELEFAAPSASLPPPSLPGETMNAMVMVNDLVYDAPNEIFNVREMFGEGAILIEYSSGQPVITNEMGFLKDLLTPGALYYLISSSS